MEIFFCWSGERSRRVAEGFKNALEGLGPTLGQPAYFSGFISPQIPKGEVWFDAVTAKLQSVDAGIVVVAPENLRSPWLHFEAGALAHGMRKVGPRGQIFTYLIGVDPGDVTGPLAQYQHTIASKTDTLALVTQLLSEDLREKWEKEKEVWWKGLAAEFRRVAVLRPTQVIPELRSLFHRKTFNEPLAECTSCAWIDRYSGARETLHTLRDHLPRIRSECRPYAADLLQQLVEELDGYAMAMRASLIVEKEFPIESDGLLQFVPAGIREACESRRHRILRLQAALADDARSPVFEEAPHFERLETSELRKNFIHRKIAELDSALEQPNREVDWNQALPVPQESEQKRGLSSEWALDRVLAYYLVTRVNTDLCLGLEWAWKEWEKIISKGPNASRMPLHYSLDVLEQSFVANGWTITGQQAPQLNELFECLLDLEKKVEISRIRNRITRWDAKLRDANTNSGIYTPLVATGGNVG